MLFGHSGMTCLNPPKRGERTMYDTDDATQCLYWKDSCKIMTIKCIVTSKKKKQQKTYSTEVTPYVKPTQTVFPSHMHTHTSLTASYMKAQHSIYTSHFFFLNHTRSAPTRPRSVLLQHIQVFCVVTRVLFFPQNTRPPWKWAWAATAGCPSNVMRAWRRLRSWSFAICLWRATPGLGTKRRRKRVSFCMRLIVHDMLEVYIICFESLCDCPLQNKIRENLVPDMCFVHIIGDNRPTVLLTLSTPWRWNQSHDQFHMTTVSSRYDITWPDILSLSFTDFKS